MKRSRIFTALSIAVALSFMPMAANAKSSTPDPNPSDVATYNNGIRIEATFNDPFRGADKNGALRDTNILRDYVRLVDSVPRGSVIRAGIFNASGGTGSTIYNSFEAAQDRGVRVHAVQSGKGKESAVQQDIAKLLGANHTWCQNKTSDGSRNTACLSNQKTGNMHMKFALFSRAKDKNGKEHKHAIWVSSANFTNASGNNLYNNAITIYGDSDLYDQLRTGMWNKMVDPNYATSDFYNPSADRGLYHSKKSKVTIYVGPDATPGVDMYADRLKPFVADKDCDVYVQHIRFKRTLPSFGVPPAERLKRMANGGCTVKALTYRLPKGAEANQADYLAPTVQTIFTDTKGMTMRCAPIHDKSMLIRARTSEGGALRYFVFGGSHNLSTTAQRYSDEMIIKVDSKDLYVGFRDHFRKAWANSDALGKACAG